MARVGITEESAEVEVLFANMDKLKNLTRKIQSSLDRLDNSGRSVQSAVRPIYGNTSRLQVTNTNIDRINAAIDKMRQPLDRRRREEPVIRGGLQKSGLPEYLACMDRTNQAFDELKRSPLKSNQNVVAELNDLLRHGVKELESSFRDTLKEDSTPYEPLHYLTKQLPFPTISSENSSKLRQINSYISASKADKRQPQTPEIYTEVRGPYLHSTLQNLAMSSVGTARKTNPDANYQQGTCAIGTYSQALEKAFNAEYDSLTPVFARDSWITVHTATCQQALDEFSKTLRELHKHITNNLVTDCYLAYEIVDIVGSLSFRLENRNPDLKQPIQDALRPVRETAKYSLEKLLNDLRSKIQSIPTLPQDGTPVSITTETMNRLTHMASYINPLSSILASLGGPSGWKSPGGAPGSSNSNSTGGQAPTLGSLDVGVSGTDLFYTYISDTLEVLLTGLEQKAKILIKARPAQGVFLANNLALIDRAIAENFKLQDYISDATRQKLEKWRKAAVNHYMDGWSEPARMITDSFRTGGPGRPASGSTANPIAGADSVTIVKSLSSKQKDDIKEKFKQFNHLFDEMVARHNSFKMEREVKPMLAKEVQTMVGRLYDQFWDRYHEIDKGKGKYVKYDKQQLSNQLGSLA